MRSRVTRLPHPPAVGCILVGVFVLALINRLIPVLRGAGLSGVLGYDDGVYYAGAVGLANGRMPYRDFLLLHPPGVLVALAPVAEFGQAVSEVAGWEVSRVAWMVMGCCTSLVVVWILLPVGKLAGTVGGCVYAVFPGAVLVERTTLLEGLTNLCLATALALLIPQLASNGPTWSHGLGRRWVVPIGAGALLGFATTVKIWSVVPLVIVCIFAAAVIGVWYGVLVMLGAASTATFVCLPFFLTAPAEMWRMVVLDQIGRDDKTGVLKRAAEVVTMGHAPESGLQVLVVLMGVGGLIAACLVAWRITRTRVAVPLLASTVGLLLASPIFFPHYLGALAVPIALVAGAITAHLGPRFERRRWRLAALTVGCLVLTLDAIALSLIRSGESLPAELGGVVQPAPGCLTADDPNSLLALGVIGRNIDRNCDLVVDLGGYSHDLSRGTAMPRGRNLAWQGFSTRYLGSGHYTLVTRFSEGHGFTSATAAEIGSWPVRQQAYGYEVRQPNPLTSRE
jgi:hypothetical protein